MRLALTVGQVATLAPDATSLTVGRKLAASRDWSGIGHNERALWGECKGSALYQVRIDLADLSSKCSCPSRKFPCKHALGLMLMAAADPSVAASSTAPGWVEEWLARRGAAAEKKERKVRAGAAAPVDEKAQTRRAEKRAERVAEGLAALDLWIADLVRNGLANVSEQDHTFWETQAARMVDAQAPGIASRLRRIGIMPRRAPDWSRRVLVELGRIALLTEAHRRLESLDGALQADVRALIGWTLKDEEVTSRGTAADDRWLVIGQRTEYDHGLRIERSWLLGLTSRRYALVLQFGHISAAFVPSIFPGTAFDARLRFWPSAWPSRALIEERRGVPERWSGEAPAFADFDALLAEMAAAIAAQPWMDRLPCVVRGVRPARSAPQRWQLVDASRRALPLASQEHWKLAALSGGHPIDIAAEWDGDELLPLAAIVDGVYEPLST
jgi:hypothetical protein